MRNWFTLFMVCLSFTFLQAQIEKGTWVLGEKFNANSIVNIPASGIGFSVEGFKFTSKRWAIGGGLSNISAFFDDSDNIGFLQLRPSVRYYLRNNEDKFKLFLQGRTQFTLIYGDDSDTNFDLGVDLGTNLLLTESLAFEFSINYSPQNLIGTGIGGTWGYSAGFRWVLNPNKEKSDINYSKTGKWIVGGSDLFGSLDFLRSGSSTFQLELVPNVGYFLTDRLMVGLNSNISILDSRSFSSTGLGIGPNLRYYPLNVEGKFQPFVDASASFIWFSQQSDFSDSNFTVQRYELGVGATWFIDDNIAIEPELYFNYNQTGDFGSVNRNVVLDVALQFFLGK
ncbi:MAG: hypothetical protein AAFO07_26575 [Bacteroidota bacterium]